MMESQCKLVTMLCASTFSCIELATLTYSWLFHTEYNYRVGPDDQILAAVPSL